MLWDTSKDTKPEVELDEVSKCILQAVEVIKERGWCQGKLHDASGQVCMAGAFFTPLSCDHEVLFLRKVFNRIQGAIGLIGPWNDAPHRSKEEVINKLIEIAYQGK